MMPPGLKVNIQDGSFPILPIFELIMKKGNVDKMDMYKTFNMGIGLVLAVSKDDLEKTLNTLKQLNEDAFVIGNVTKGEGIEICLK